MASLFDNSLGSIRRRLTELYPPLAASLFPVGAYHSRVEGHVLAKIKDFAYSVQIRPYVCGI